MAEPPRDWPDFTNATLLTGVDGDGNPIAVLLDETGQLYTVLRGIDGSGDPQTVKVDVDGQLYTVLQGASGVAVLVDDDGFISAMLKGIDAGSDPQSVKVDSDGQLYTVLQGASGVAVAVDENGYITAVLKGQESGALSTIAVDANGRIEAFILDSQSQWGDVLRVGNAELAARLGSGKVWDWRGDQLYFNDFSRGLGNITNHSEGTGATISIDPAYWTQGGYSLKMVGGSDGNENSHFRLYLEHPPSSVMGLEVHLSGDLDFEYFYIKIKRYVSAKIWTAGLRIESDVPPNIQYLNSAGAWTTIGTSYMGVNIEMFNHLKIVADYSEEKYVRALWGEIEIDLSAQGLRQEGTGYLNQMIVECYLKARSGNNDVRYLDYVLVTVNEPL